MKIIKYNNCTEEEKKKLLKRPSIIFEDVNKIVRKITDDVKYNGSFAAIKYARLYDNFQSENIFASESEINNSIDKVPEEFLNSIKVASENIRKFHKYQLAENYSVETMPGIKCSYKYLPIENVGIYIPGGTAVLPSTILMLSIPALLAGCQRIVMITPVKENLVNPILLSAAKISGIQEILKIGGAQGIALAAYGDSIFKKVDKIFGPGNQFVTSAKTIVAQDESGCAIDMPAGPSEVLIIADQNANPKFIAADLLSQAEHGNDSQSMLVATDLEFIKKVETEINKQKELLNRKNIIEESLSNCCLILVDNLEEAYRFSNLYAPEHLIINHKNYERFINKIKNAGSVFLGAFSPESVGDYASGTNHSLPTYGFAKSYSGVSVRDYQKTISFQELTKEGLSNISDTVINLAYSESLDAHANAVKVRLENEY